jgi:serine/threonine-protein kinase
MSITNDPPDERGPLPEGVFEGAVLAGKYRIGAVIGSGAMGTVVQARHLLLDEDVAIKFLFADRLKHKDAVQRFVKEAKAPLRIQSEHVVRVLDVAVLEGGVPYIVMEHLTGKDLASRLRWRGPLPVEEAVDFLLEGCEAISESHRIGIIHRDLKPANLFVLEREGASPILKVLDFGISKSVRLIPETLDLEGTLQSAQITQDRAILGSPFYMSPEQMESARDVDARTDIWALGVTLFELVTGAPPFRGTSLVQVYATMASSRAGGWRQALSKHPPGLEAVIGKCLEWDRDRRYASADDLARALAPFGSKHSAQAPRRIARIPRASDSNAGVESASLPRFGAGRSAGRNLIGAVLAGFVGSAIFLFVGRPKTVVVEDHPPAMSVSAAASAALPRQASAADMAATEVPAPVMFEVDRAQDTAVRPEMSVAAASMQAPSPPTPSPDVPAPRVSKPAPKPAGSTLPSATPPVLASPSPVVSAAAAALATPLAPSKFAPDKIKEMLDRRE